MDNWEDWETAEDAGVGRVLASAVWVCPSPCKPPLEYPAAWVSTPPAFPPLAFSLSFPLVASPLILARGLSRFFA